MAASRISRLKLRALILTILPAVLMALGLVFYVGNTQLHNLYQEFDARGEVLAKELSILTAFGLQNGDPSDIGRILQPILNESDVVAIALEDANGSLILRLYDLEYQQLSLDAKQDGTRLFSAPIQYYSPTGHKRGLDIQPKQIFGKISVEISKQQLNVHHNTLIWNSIIILITGILTTSVLAWFFVAKFTSPITRLTEAVTRVRSGDFSAVLPEVSKDELGSLEAGFNSMATELKNAQEVMRYQIIQATSDLTQTMEALEIQNVELDLAKKRAQKASLAKTEFLASMSHEIRTPLNGVIGFARLLLKSKLTPKQHDIADTIQKSALGLLDIINSILDYSKLEYGSLEPLEIPFNVDDCFENPVILLAPVAHDKDLELVLMVYSDVPRNLIGDETRIRQILVNLIGNAIKFTGHGEVIVRVMLEDDTSDQCTIRFSVCDTGIGIPENVQKRLFTSFHQADSSTSKEFGGTGLGLSISRKLAESMKGQISVESKPDEGACFSVILPLIKQHQENGGTEPAPYSGQQCLILDSHHLCGLSIGHHIEALGMEASVHDFSDPTSMYPDYIDLVILSFSPPYIREGRVDTAIQNIQAITDAPILALMSTSEYGLLNRVKQLGVAQSMSRPLGHESLCRSIDEIMSGESDSQFVTPKEFVPLFSRFRFLVADDNPINLKLITTILSTTKAAIDTAENGREVVSLVSKQKYDIILLDVHMPVMDGIEATKIIRKSESAEKRTPIVALTADTVPEHRSQVMKSGVDGYLLKPVEEQELWTILSQLLGIEFNNTIDTDIGKSTSPENKWVNKADLPSRDIEAGLKISGGRQELADSIFIQFMQELPRHLDVLRKAHKTFQYAKIKERSHLLHGATAVCGVPAINAMVDKLERIALDKDDEKIKALFIQIEKEVNKLSKIKERLNMSDSQS